MKKLFIGNLPFTAEESQLRALFEEGGRRVTSLQLITDKMTGRAKGFGFVEFESDEEATQAMEALNGKDFGGRAMLVNEAREKTAGFGGSGPRRDSGFGRGSFFGGGSGGGGRNSRNSRW